MACLLHIYNFLLVLTPAERYISMLILCNCNNVCNYCTCSRKLSCTATVEHALSKHISLYHNTVKYIIYHKERMIIFNHYRCYECVKLIIFKLCITEKLYRCIKMLCILKICCIYLCDTLCMNIFKVYFLACCKR